MSSDLLQWEERAITIPRTDSTMIFSGGVVADTHGTTGLCSGPDCLVALYTSFNALTRVQNQSLAFSSDGGDHWTQYDGNPVLDIGSTEFRDTWVFWHAESDAWVMAVALAQEHQVRDSAVLPRQSTVWVERMQELGKDSLITYVEYPDEDHSLLRYQDTTRDRLQRMERFFAEHLGLRGNHWSAERRLPTMGGSPVPEVSHGHVPPGHRPSRPARPPRAPPGPGASR